MELEDKEEQLQMALISADLGTWYINAKTRDFLPSPRLKEMFGFNSNEDMPYDAAVNQIADSHRTEVINSVEDALSKGIAYNLEYPIIGFRDNKLRWVKATGKLFNDSNGNPIHFSGTVSDITVRKEEDQRREDFLSIASHELKSPLTALKGYLQIMNAKAQTIANDMFTNLTLRAVSQTEKMEKLITGFLDLARAGKSKLQLNRSFFDLSDLAKATEKETSISVKSHILIYKPIEFTPVEADWDKIEQVLMNLINNAVKYSPLKSTIKVACITLSDFARFSVTDEGRGVSQQHQKNIFERFYRIQDDANRNISGFGIGLYICKEIIDLHKGTIGVDSAVGKGSTFWFEIPVAAEDLTR
ncbi:PAS domain-containing sensor histidine kinase [Pedobacter aquatilis]|uniref:sensor histidine kinase n=1 Tax=Pedobacter aquatilis TaxID=351343 RepID=UPI00292CDFAD|nr:PAS domain-containing sensor histidine kinase [Pedobacter aquatilis]